jgi:uncharacterized membrane protein YkoI
MKKRNALICALCMSVSIALPALASDVTSKAKTIVAESYAGHELSNRAKLDISQARAIAIKAQAGEIADQELEKERGGSGLRYSFGIKASKGVHEVGVDAVTGNVLENSLEGENPD